MVVHRRVLPLDREACALRRHRDPAAAQRAEQADRLAPLYETLNLANDQVWDGGFTFWSKQRLRVWRYGLVLAGDAVASAEQVDQMISNALLSCERFYPSFQLVAWGNSSPAAALDIALGEAYGRA